MWKIKRRIIHLYMRGSNIISKVNYMICNIIGGNIWRFETNPYIMVFIDGGMASQIARATLGKQFEEKGFRVKYQIDFFKEKGYDMCHEESRDYILDICFPDSNVEIASYNEIKHYKLFYDYESGKHGTIESIDKWDINRPIYFSGYSSDFLMDINRCPDFFKLDEIKPLLYKNAINYYQIIIDNRDKDIINVGVHVRRGDMTLTGFYWKVLTGKYFVEAIRRLKESTSSRICLFFFSNGFDFVQEEIIPFIDNTGIILVDKNEHEYEDFFLLCKCDVQIESQGSWGRLAYIYNENPNKRLVTYKGIIDDKTIVIDLTEDMYIDS